METNNTAIEVKGLHYTYRALAKPKNPKREALSTVRETLSDLSFRVALGKITGLLGPNGSGKSTTFKIISTQIRAHQGDVWILGHSASREPSKVRSFLGVTFQNPSLDPWLSVEENLRIQAALFALTAAEAKARIAELVEVFQLQEKFRDRVSTLSGGWARRVELAKSLLHKPKILLLDEPTTGLDPLVKKNFWQELKKLRASGVSILVTTHLMDEAEQCDELIFISDGKLAASGEPERLKESLGADIVWIGIDDVAEAQSELARRFPDARMRVEERGLRLETQRALDLLDFSREHWKSRLKSLTWSKPDLADVYFSKTGKSLYDSPQGGPV